MPESGPKLTSPASLPEHIRLVLFGGDGGAFPARPVATPPGIVPVPLVLPSRVTARVVQSGNHVFERKASVALNRFHRLKHTKEEWGKALENLKSGNGVPPRAVLAISEEGHVFDGETWIANLLPYLSGASSGHRGHSQLFPRN